MKRDKKDVVSKMLFNGRSGISTKMLKSLGQRALFCYALRKNLGFKPDPQKNRGLKFCLCIIDFKFGILLKIPLYIFDIKP